MAKLFPTGIQTFEVIRKRGRTYVDKTELVYRLVHDAAKYVFLNRPGRFVKYLLVSTLKSYFEGRKDLFEGLSIARLEDEWTERPVLHFSMSTAKHMGEAELESELRLKLSGHESIYGRNPALRLEDSGVADGAQKAKSRSPHSEGCGLYF